MYLGLKENDLKKIIRKQIGLIYFFSCNLRMYHSFIHDKPFYGSIFCNTYFRNNTGRHRIITYSISDAAYHIFLSSEEIGRFDIKDRI